MTEEQENYLKTHNLNLGDIREMIGDDSNTSIEQMIQKLIDWEKSSVSIQRPDLNIHMFLGELPRFKDELDDIIDKSF